MITTLKKNNQEDANDINTNLDQRKSINNNLRESNEKIDINEDFDGKNNISDNEIVLNIINKNNKNENIKNDVVKKKMLKNF